MVYKSRLTAFQWISCNFTIIWNFHREKNPDPAYLSKCSQHLVWNWNKGIHHSLRALQMKKSQRLEWLEAQRAKDWMVRSRFGLCPTCTVYIWLPYKGSEYQLQRESILSSLGTAFRILTACILHTSTWATGRDCMLMLGLFLFLETYCMLQGTASIGYSLLHRPVLVHLSKLH